MVVGVTTTIINGMIAGATTTINNGMVLQLPFHCL
jgi:hypothetical protein